MLKPLGRAAFKALSFNCIELFADIKDGLGIEVANSRKAVTMRPARIGFVNVPNLIDEGEPFIPISAGYRLG